MNRNEAALTRKRPFYWLLALSALILFLNVGGYGVVETSDARYAEIAREMLRNGDWLHPDFLNIHHYHKPPFTYQITALGYAMFGVNPFGARFFLQIALLLSMVLTYRLALTLYKDRTVALWSAAIFFSFPLTLSASRNLTTDLFLTLWVIAAVYAWVRYRQSGRWRWLYAFTLALAMGFLTKGPVVLIVPGIFALLYNRIEPAKNRWSLHHLAAWLLFIAVGGSWYFYLMAQNPDFWNYFVEKQTIKRFDSDIFRRKEPWWYFLLFVPLTGLPWLLAMPWTAWRQRVLLKSDNIITVLLITAAVTILFFSLSTSKRILYILPLYPLLAIVTAVLLKHSAPRLLRPVTSIVVAWAVIVTASFALLPWLPVKVHLNKSATLVAITMAALLWIVWKKWRQDPKSRLVALTFLTSGFLVVMASWLLAANPLKFKIATPLAHFIRTHHLQNRILLVYDRLLPSLAFELDRSLITLNDGARSLRRETRFEPDSSYRRYFYDLRKPEDRRRLLRLMQKEPTLLIVHKRLPKRAEDLKTVYTQRKKIGPWMLYYSKDGSSEKIESADR